MVKKFPTIQTITNMNYFVEYDKLLMFEFQVKCFFIKKTHEKESTM